MFYRTIELVDDIRAALVAGTLRIQRGQWLSFEGGRGIFLGVVREEIKVLWRFLGESLRDLMRRVKAAVYRVPRSRRRRVQHADFWPELCDV